jgi:hypothetical protein
VTSSLASQARSCLDLLAADADWAIRRKHRVDLLEPTLFRHQLSLDFELPAAAAELSPGVRLVPIALMRKAPGDFFRFDLRDEVDRSLPFPTRIENGTLSAAALLLLAQKVVGSSAVTDGLAEELSYIAHAPKSNALSLIVNEWMQEPQPRRGHPKRLVRTQEGFRGKLAKDPNFWWLVRALAHSSIVALPVEGTVGDRRLIKLSFDEVVPDFSSGSIRHPTSWLRALGNRSGYRGYKVSFVVPWSTARSFHFELHSPAGLEVIEAGFQGREPQIPENRAHVHLYAPFESKHAERNRVRVPYVQFRLRGTALSVTAVAAATGITALMWLCSHEASHLSGSGLGPGASVLMLFPALIASYLARPEHPVTARLMNLSRGVLFGMGILAIFAAARFAIATDDHPASADGLRSYFTILGWVGVAGTALLALNLIFPFRLHGRVRRATRWRPWRP